MLRTSELFGLRLLGNYFRVLYSVTELVYNEQTIHDLKLKQIIITMQLIKILYTMLYDNNNYIQNLYSAPYNL